MPPLIVSAVTDIPERIQPFDSARIPPSSLIYHSSISPSIMDNKFPLFPRFPPEIRQTIWRFALAQCWSFTRLKRRDRRVKLVGEVHRAVTQACREARAVMRNTHTNIDALGWIDFSRHLFFFRDAKFDSSLMQRVAARHGLLAHIQHMVLNPRNWPQLWYTVDVMRSSCTSLCTLVIVAPWFKPPPADATYKEIELAPYEDWSPVFCQTPTEINVVPLLEAIERCGAANAVWIAQYRAKLGQVVRRLPDNMPEWENTYGRTRTVLQKLEKAVRGFPDRTPTLYLRTREELCFRPATSRSDIRLMLVWHSAMVKTEGQLQNNRADTDI